MVWTLCLRILSNREDAMDAFQSTWCRLLIEIKSNQFGTARIEDAAACQYFLYRLTIREAQNLRKRRGRHTQKELAMDILDSIADSDAGAHEQAARNQLRDHLETLVRLLPENNRLPLQLTLFHGLSQKEISLLLETTQGTVSRRIGKGIKQLKILIRKAGLTDAFKGGIALGTGATLLNPPKALGASLIFSNSQAALAAGGMASVSALSNLGPLGTKLFWGITFMKSKMAILTTVAAITLLSFSLYPEFSARDHDRSSVNPRYTAEEQAKYIAPHKDNITTGSLSSIPLHHLFSDDELMSTGNAKNTPQSMAVMGQVIDSESMTPIPGVTVRISDKIKTISDSKGFYELKGVTGDTIETTASAEGYAARRATVHVSTNGATRHNFELDPAIDFTVEVADEKGAPIEGAKIDVDGFHFEFIERLGITDVHGQLLVQRVSRITPPHNFEAEKTGYMTGICTKSQFSINPEKSRGTAKIVLKTVSDLTRVITGEIKDAQGVPVPLVTVQWSPRLGRQEGRDQTMTDQNGRYILVFEHETKDCKLSVYAEGWAPAVREGIFAGTVDKPAIENFTMDHAHWLSGEVLDEAGRPVANARVQVMPERRLLNSWSYPGVMRRTLTDANGKFILNNLSGPQVALALVGPGDGWSDLEIPDQKVDLDDRFTLDHAGVIIGRVLDKETGESVPTFNIKIFGTGISIERVEPGETFNSTTGEFVLKSLNNGNNYRVVVEAKGYVPVEELSIPAESEQTATPHEFKISTGHEIQGYIVDSGTNAPIEGAKLSHGIWEGSLFHWSNIPGRRSVFNLQEMTVDASGQFRFIEDKPGTIFIQAEGYRSTVIKPEDRAQYQINPDCLWIPVKHGESIHGTCYKNGQPGKAYLGLLFMGAAAGKSTDIVQQGFDSIVVGDDGSFEQGGLVPGVFQLYTYWIFPEKYLGGMTCMYRSFELADGEHKKIDFGDDLGSLTFSGRLIDMTGKPFNETTLILKPAFDWTYTKFEAIVSEDCAGRFTFPNLLPGHYMLEATSSNHPPSEVISLGPIDLTGDLDRDLQIAPAW